MSVHHPYKNRIEIRLEPELKQAAELLCSDKGINLSFYIRGLIRRNLKKNSRIITKLKAKPFDGDVWDMPADPNYDKEEWIKTA